MNTRITVAALAAVLSAAAAFGDATIPFDPSTPAFKDQREHRSGSCIGYAGCVTDIGGKYTDEFMRDPDALWEQFQKSGAYVVKQWSANEDWNQSMAYQRLKTDAEREEFRRKYPNTTFVAPEKIWQWRKDHGIRILLCLENYGVTTNYMPFTRTDDIAVVKEKILEMVQWIVDNGFQDQVIGFELGNEPYFGSEPEKFAARWSEIVPEMKRIFPEAEIGFSIAEYRDGDPDVAAVRARSTAVDKWFEGGSEFGFNKINQWSGRFIVAFSNCLDLCSHVIYHFYGGDAAYGCGASGFARIRNFAKAFPEVKDKRVWITEWRERSDEDCRCQQMHSSSIFKAHYALACICQPEIDSINLHSCNSLAGGFDIATGDGSWYVQWDPAGRDFSDPDFTGRPRIETGPVGPVFSMYNQALIAHPLIMDHGVWEGGSITNSSYWSANIFYGFHHAMVGWLTYGADPKKLPKNKGNAEWVLATNPERTSIAILVCNSTRSDWKPTLAMTGAKPGQAHYRTFSCPDEKRIFVHQIPGEPRPTVEAEYDGDAASLVVPAYTIATITIPVVK